MKEFKQVQDRSYISLKTKYPSVFAIRKVNGYYCGMVEVAKLQEQAQ